MNTSQLTQATDLVLAVAEEMTNTNDKKQFLETLETVVNKLRLKDFDKSRILRLAMETKFTVISMSDHKENLKRFDNDSSINIIGESQYDNDDINDRI